MKKIYETIIIYDTTVPITTDTTQLKTILQTMSNTYVVEFQDLGEKILAYKIKSHTSGHYVQYTWEGDTTDTITIQSILQKNPHVLKFLTTVNSERELQPIVDVKSLLYYYY